MAIVQSRAKRKAVANGLSEIALARKFRDKPPMARTELVRDPVPRRLIAYDFETERIKVGTPRPKYLTAFGEDFYFASRVETIPDLHSILIREFLTEGNYGVSFVAWNGNRFDAYYIAAALVRDERFRLRPYLTRSKALRGLRVTLAEDGDKRTSRTWEFLDGIAQLGLTGTKLEKLLKTFAPNHLKMTHAINFKKEEFDANNPMHCDYAMQDSVGLYHAMVNAQNIMMSNFEQPLGVTMGGACIKIFQRHIPEDVNVDSMTPDGEQIARDFVMRGGFCYCARRFTGPVWKYDINQAYAAAMRESELPHGGALHGRGNPPTKSKAFLVRIEATNGANKIPFYYRTVKSGRIRSMFGITEIFDTWVTSSEYCQLRAEGWRIRCIEFWAWPKVFNMRDYVDKLERLRTTCEGGPNGAIGTMTKATGNHSYGKLCEDVSPIEFILADECPPDYLPFYGDGSEPIEHVYYRFDLERRPKPYHKVHVASFITAHVRMVVRRAALLAPDSWLYADTDCVIFDRDVTAELDIDPKRYGAWKVEDAGTIYQILAKKVYREVSPGGKRSAKGMNVNDLTDDEFNEWYHGNAPVQNQIQIQNFLAVMEGEEMYRSQRRTGTRIEAETGDS